MVLLDMTDYRGSRESAGLPVILRGSMAIRLCTSRENQVPLETLEMMATQEMQDFRGLTDYLDPRERLDSPVLREDREGTGSRDLQDPKGRPEPKLTLTTAVDSFKDPGIDNYGARRRR
jgi:hypothetical protein